MSQPVLWQMSGGSVSAINFFGVPMPAGWVIAGTGDFDGNGQTDLLWATGGTGGSAFLWLTQPDGSVSAVSLAQYPMPSAKAWVGDFDGDGKSDILWDMGSSAPILWKMNGGTLISASTFGTNMPPGWKIAGVGDFDGNGKADLLWTTKSSPGPAFLWMNQGNGQVTSASLASYGAMSGKAWIADFDGDGKSDILWDYGSTTPILWKMNGAAVTSASRFGVNMPPGWKIAATGEFDGTGLADLVWTTSAPSSPAYLWLTQGNGTVAAQTLARFGQVPGVPFTGVFHGTGVAPASAISQAAPYSDAAGALTNGVCGGSNGAALYAAPTNSLCQSGTLTPVTGSGPWSWNCYGSNGGSSAQCLAYAVLRNGACGTANGVASAVPPSSNLCFSGTATSMTDAGTWQWRCVGGNGASAFCSAPQTAGNGQCGSASGTSATTAPSANLCSFGTASLVSGSGPWAWSCTGNGSAATTAQCSATLPAANGQCGSANGVTVSSAPSANLCSTGTASAVGGAGPWTWNCQGANGGTTASCSAPVTALNGQCGSANGTTVAAAPSANLCSTGTASSVGGSGPWTWNCAGNASGTTSQCSANPIQVPGPSLALFNHPYYSCVHNYYVSTTGSDMNNGTSPSTPWLTLQHANDAGRTAGDCVNVAPGTYNKGVLISNGGNLASSTGYVVYRCATMDACVIPGNSGVHNAEAFETRQNTSGTPPNYLIIDGFVMSGANNSSNGVGISVWNGDNSANIASHHIWSINNIISGFGQSGIGIAASEYYYIIHNTIYDNSNLQCNSQGSGIAINIMHAVPNYVPTADDITNPDSLIAPTWAVGNTYFHNVAEWNVIYNNAITQCGTVGDPYDTDGNGLIFDSNLIANGDTENYSNQSLVDFNVVYNSGGGGIHIFVSAYITVANNNCYNNDLDPGNQGTGRACMDSSGGYANTFFNNIAVAIPVAPNGQCTFGQPPYAAFNVATLGAPVSGSTLDTWTNNITQLQGGQNSCWNSENLSFNGDTYSCTANKCATNPMWVNVGTTSTGSETTPPVATNFALKPGSPAIGTGLTKTYLSKQSIDIGACSSALTSCP